jgi:hypothetical protein
MSAAESEGRRGAAELARRGRVHYLEDVCVTKLLLTSGCVAWMSRAASPVGGNTSGSPYRVLREPMGPRGSTRSVDRECTGPNATSVKGSSSDKHTVPWWPSQYEEAKAASSATRAHICWAAPLILAEREQRLALDTTGVQDLGMYTRPAVERERSARGRITASRPRSRVREQGLRTKLGTTPRAEVRCSRSSEEVG